MATCKNCLHLECCEMQADYKEENTGYISVLDYSSADRCTCFRDKANFVELPCQIGDTAHKKDGAWNVVGFECDRSGSWRVKLERWKDEFLDYHVITKIVFKSFGKSVFLTSEEASAYYKKKVKNNEEIHRG